MAASPSRPDNHLIRSLSDSDYALLRPYLADVRLKQKVILQEAGEPITHVYFPTSGMISLLATFETGEAIEIAAIGKEGAVGSRVGSPPHRAFAQAIVQLPGSALKIEIGRYLQAAERSPAILNVATRASQIMEINLQQSAACNALHPLEARLARWILHSRDRFDHDELPLVHQFLSEMLGTRRTTVSLAAFSLQKAGAISYTRGKIRITNRIALESISCDCYRVVKRNIESVASGLLGLKPD